MSGRRFIRWQSNGALEWTFPLAALVTGVGVLLLGAATVAYLVAPEPSGFVLTGAAMGGVALVIGISGRVTTVRQLRYSRMALPSPLAAPANGQGSGDRRVVRRPSGLPYALMTVVVLGFAANAYVNWSFYPRTLNLFLLVLGGAFLVGGYLSGPVARFVVTPEHLRVESAFHIVRIPRELIRDFESSDTKVALELTTGESYSFRVDSALWEQLFRTNRATQQRTVARIVAALHAVPAGRAGADQVVVRRRPVMITLAVTAAAAAVAAAVVMVTYAAG